MFHCYFEMSPIYLIHYIETVYAVVYIGLIVNII